MIVVVWCCFLKVFDVCCSLIERWLSVVVHCELLCVMGCLLLVVRTCLLVVDCCWFVVVYVCC